MKIIISGLTRTGRTLTKVLKEDGHAVTVIDKKPAAVAAAEKEFGVSGIIGHGAMYETLTEAGADRCDLFIGAESSDELNILSCLSAKHVGAGHTAALSCSPDFLGEMTYFSTVCGVDLMFNPEHELASEICRAIRIPAAVNVISFAGGRAELAHVSVTEGADIIGKTLAAVRLSSKLSVLVCAVKRNGGVMIPDGRFVIEKGDEIYITGPHEDIYSFLKMIGMPDSRIKNVIIAGAGNSALYLAGALEKAGIGVKIIDGDKLRCAAARERLSRARAVCCDPFDSGALSQEAVADAGAVMAMSDSDEYNVLLSMYARKNGAKKVITKLSGGALAPMLPDMGYNGAVFSEDKTLSRIALSYVRALAQTRGSAIGTVCKIADGGAEIVEFIAKPGFAYAGVPLMKLNLRPGLLIAGIIRGREVLYPNGMTSILEGYRVIIVSSGGAVKGLDSIVSK